MKILFLINNPATAASSEWDELKSAKEKGALTPSKDFYAMVKALEMNKDFENEILSARKNIEGLPEEGMSWQDYEEFYMNSLAAYSDVESKKYDDFFAGVKEEAERIKARMKLDPYIAYQLDKLIIGGFVYPEDFPITYGATPIDEGDLREGYGEVYIRITHPVAQNTLTEFIKANWRHMNSYMKSMRPKPNYYISKRDLRIVELKDKENLDWNKIIDKVTEEFNIDDYDGKLNMISVKKQYDRAKEKINLAAGNIKSDK